MGPIGRTVHLAASDAGCGPVYATDNIDERCRRPPRRLQLGRQSTRRNVVADNSRARTLGLDVVFECCGQQAALDDAVDLLRPGGTLVIIGIPEVDGFRSIPKRSAARS